MDREIIIETHKLCKRYKDVTALKSLDLKVYKNSICGFLGPNGAGKTTVIKLLLGLIKPSGGTGTIFDCNINDESVKIRNRIGYLPQEPHFYNNLTARETLDFSMRFFFKGPREKIKNRIEELLDLVGLSDKADRPIKGFSGGERQRLGIAQAEVNYPDLLILDEPAAALDPIGRLDVLNIMEKLRSQTTIFYSTHILDDVQKISDTVAILNKGVLAASGPVSDLLAGEGNTVYSLRTRGNPEKSAACISDLPWVTKVILTECDSGHRWTVSVTDKLPAEQHLLRKVLEDGQLIVDEFGRKTYELEEVFVNVVGGKSNV